MTKTQFFKRAILRKLALVILGNTSLERALCYLCSQPSIRNQLRLGAIPFTYLSALDRTETRVADLGEYKIWVNIAEYIGMNLYFFKQHHEPFAAWLISNLVGEGDVCVDVGANMGSYTFLMASKVGSRGRVFAFEPYPDLYKMLLSSIGINQFSDFVFVDNRALYSKSGECLKFYVSENPNNSGTSSLVNHGVFLNTENFIRVNTVTLSDYFKEANIEHCHLVKIDVERAELEVLRGMVNLLENQRINYIIIEQFSDSESKEIFSQFNYKGYLVKEETRSIIDNDAVEKGYFGNYIFVSPNHLADFQKTYVNSLS